MKKLSGSFRNTQWDPVLLIFQILAMQTSGYFSLGLIMALMEGLAGSNHTLDHIFQYHEIHVADFGGKLVISAFVLNALCCAGLLWLVVKRTKLCLDFSCTWFFIHLIICWYYNSGFPWNFSWWLLHAVCVALMCITGEFLCLRTELNDIPLGLSAKADL
uniref:Protein SYS1 homolog n=1 Tax=Xenopsylla cheopis TaxID=163159 RepID=A0A6M2DWS1_XENCH